MSEQQAVSASKRNILSGYFRQPKIYIRLPSEGKFYPPGSLDVSSTGDYPVYAMTAKDELMFKTPDALLNGQSTVEVIKSCVPAILDPWKMPSLDLDTVLIAIRIATYGESMDLDVNCPACAAENSYAVNLTHYLDKVSQFKYVPSIDFNELKIFVRPYSYHEVTKTGIKTFEQQRLFSVINSEELNDEEKLELFGKSFVKLTELTVDIIAGCISRIETPEGSTDNQADIKEFINNCSKDLFDQISNHITGMKAEIELQPLDGKCQSCSHEFVVPVTMDHSNFFAVRS